MAGRNNHRGGGRGRGGRGRNTFRRNGNENTNATRPNAKKTISQCEYKTSKPGEYMEITEVIINHIKQKYRYGEDIAIALEDGKEFDFKPLKPTMEIHPNLTDEEKNNPDTLASWEAREKEINHDYKFKSDLLNKRIETYYENSSKANALLEEKCSKNLLHKIKQRVEYDKEIKGSMIKMMITIREEVYNFTDTRYDMSIAATSAKEFLNLKQAENEPIDVYHKRFVGSRNRLVQRLGGSIVLNEIAKKDDEYKNATKSEEKEKIKTKITERWLAYLFVENSDQSK